MLELLLPQRCVACGRSGAALCDRCLQTLPRIAPPLCERCGSPTAWPVRRCAECSGRRLPFETARAAVAYDERVRAIVAGWKEHGLRRLAATAADLVDAAIPRREVAAARGERALPQAALAAAARVEPRGAEEKRARRLCGKGLAAVDLPRRRRVHVRRDRIRERVRAAPGRGPQRRRRDVRSRAAPALVSFHRPRIR